MREARLSVGLPQDKLGVVIGLDEQTASARMSRYENGTHAPDFSTAEKIAIKLGFPVAYFVSPDDQLARVILYYSRLSTSEQQLILEKAIPINNYKYVCIAFHQKYFHLNALDSTNKKIFVKILGSLHWALFKSLSFSPTPPK